MLDHDLAELYGVETKRITEAVKRNIERFPEEFRFQLTEEEYKTLRSQIVTSKNEAEPLRSQIATLKMKTVEKNFHRNHSCLFPPFPLL